MISILEKSGSRFFVNDWGEYIYEGQTVHSEGQADKKYLWELKVIKENGSFEAHCEYTGLTLTGYTKDYTHLFRPLSTLND